MNFLKNAIRTSKKHEMVLGCLLVLYIIFNVQTPSVLSKFLNNPVAQLLVAVLAMSIFVSVNPILGVIVVVAAVEFVRRTNRKSVSFALDNYVPSESNKSKILNAVNENPIPKTLEEDVVDQMAPLGGENRPELPDSNYSPVLNNLHDASSI